MNDYFSIGYNFFKSNNFKKAAEYFNNYIDEEKNDDKTNVHYYLSICYNHLGDKNKFLEYSQVSLLDNKLKKSYKINLHNKLFNFYLETRNFNQAQIYLELLNDEKSAKYTDYDRLGILLKNNNHINQALYNFLKCVEINPKYPRVYNSIGCIYLTQKKFEISINNFKKCISLDENFRMALHNLGVAYNELDLYQESIYYYKRLLKLDNNNSDCRFNMSQLLLKYKNFSEGFSNYEHRLLCKKLEKTRPIISDLGIWDGINQCDKLLIVYEQGYGDNIQFYRFILELKNKYKNIQMTYFCKKDISHLFEYNENINIITELPSNYAELFSYKLYIMSIPYILSLNKISPCSYNYLISDKNCDKYWNDKLDNGKFKIGLTWKGNNTTCIDKFIQLEKLYPVLQLIDNEKLNIEFISLQYDTNIPDNLKRYINVYDIDKKKKFTDTISILKNINLLISVDTSIIHLAGMFNIPCWLLLGKISEWRWFKENIKTEWYKSVILIRSFQSDFQDIIDKIKNNLINLSFNNLYDEGNKLILNCNHQAAIEIFNKISVLDHNYLRSRYSLCSCYIYINNIPLAIKTLENILSYETDKSILYSHLANCYVKLKNIDKSYEYFNLVFKILGTSFLEKINYINQSFNYNNNTNDINYVGVSIVSKYNLQKGFTLLKSRFDSNFYLNKPLFSKLPDWNGTQPCKRILVLDEGNDNSTIIFYRYILELSDKFPDMNIHFFLNKKLNLEFKTKNNLKIIDNIDNSSYEYKINLFDIPSILNIQSYEPCDNYFALKNLVEIEKYKDKNIILLNIDTDKFKINKLLYKNFNFISLKKCVHDKVKHICIKSPGDVVSLINMVDIVITENDQILHLSNIIGKKTYFLFDNCFYHNQNEMILWCKKNDKIFWYDNLKIIDISDKNNDEFFNVLNNDKFINNNSIIQDAIDYFNFSDKKDRYINYLKLLELSDLETINKQNKSFFTNFLNIKAKCLDHKKQYHYSIEVYEIMIKNNLVNQEDLYYRIGVCYFQNNKLDKSIEYLKKITSINTPIYNEAMANLSIIYLKNNQLQLGSKLYEYRFLCSNKVNLSQDYQKLNIKIWDGFQNTGNLLVYSEQGLGDQIQFYRFVIEISKLYPNIYIYCSFSNSIVHLIKPYCNINIISHDDINKYDNFDYKITSMSLIHILKKEHIIPISRNLNYIITNNDKDLYWEKKLSGYKKPLIGIFWDSTNIDYLDKKINIQDMSNLNCNGTLISLQKNKYNDLPDIVQFDIDDEKAFIDTVSIMKYIDLVVSVDTSIVHIAGVMNIKTLILLKYGIKSEWRWFNDKKSSWYNNTYIIKAQSDDISWKNLLNQAKYYIENHFFKNICDTSIDKFNQTMLNEINTKIYSKNNNVIKNYNLNSAYNEKTIENYQQNIKNCNQAHQQIHLLKQLSIEYMKINKYEKALEIYKQLLEHDPNDISSFYNNIATCYAKNLDYDNAIFYYEKSIQYHKNNLNTYINYGLCLINVKMYKKAIEIFETIKPENRNSLVLYNIGLCFMYLNDINACIKNLNSSILKDRKHYDPYYLLSTLYLKINNLKLGFAFYEYRLLCSSFKNCFVSMDNVKLWNGVDMCNNLLILGEQGLGDRFQFFRFIFDLKYRYPDMKITVLLSKNIIHLFNVKNKDIRLLDTISDISEYNYKINIASLPYILKLDKITPLIDNTYIKVEETTLLKWKEKLKNLKKPKVGIFWRGNNVTYISKYIPLYMFRNIVDLEIDIICLQKDYEKDISSIDFNNKINAYNIDLEQSFKDTVAILKNIDLLITVDSAIVHLAGILNIETWLLIGSGFHSEWRWFLNEDKSRWYNSVSIYRCNDKNDFEQNLETIRSELINKFNLSYTLDNNQIYLKEINSANQLFNECKYHEAIDKYNYSIQFIEDKNYKYYYNIAMCYHKLDKYELAIDNYQKSLSFNPYNKWCLQNLGGCFLGLKKYNLAIEHYKKYQSIDDENYYIYYNLGLCYGFICDYENAIDNYKKSLNINPYYKDGKINLSLIYLKYGMLEKGFRYYEARIENYNLFPDIPLWNGYDKCKNLLICREQGLGDNIQYFRFMIDLKYKYPNINITFYSRKELGFILHYRGINVISEISSTKAYDYKIYIMSLPYILKIKEIKPIEYSTYNYILDNNITLRYLLNKRKKIGLFWKGFNNSIHTTKYIPLKYFKELFSLDADFICLQKYDYEDLLDADFKDKIIFDKNLDNQSPFCNTITILKNLDAFICVDTSLIHIAGVLNVKSYLLLDSLSNSDWRWFDIDICRWYKSVEICRNNKNNWQHIISKIVLDLKYKFNI